MGDTEPWGHAGANRQGMLTPKIRCNGFSMENEAECVVAVTGPAQRHLVLVSGSFSHGKWFH